MNMTSSTSTPSTSVADTAQVPTSSKPQAPSLKKTAVPVEATPTTVKKRAAESAKPAKEKKIKVLRDSFTIPKTELLQIGEMKKRALALGVSVKKSELIRAGLSVLSGMEDASFKEALSSIPTIKTGRPSKN